MKFYDRVKLAVNLVINRKSSDKWFYEYPHYGSINPRRLSKSEYLRYYDSWVWLAVSTIASDFSALDFRLQKDGKDIDHEYLKLITVPLLENIASYL